MKVKWISDLEDAFALLEMHDAVMFRLGDNKPILVLFADEQRREKAQRVLEGTIHNYDMLPGLSCRLAHLKKRLKKLHT